MNDSRLVFEALSNSSFPVFRDDFDNGHLNSTWTWQNRNTSAYKIIDGWLEITGGSESILTGGEQPNLLWQTLPHGDFVIVIHISSQPLFDFQKTGLILFADTDNYISLSRGYCMKCVLGGSGIFLEHSLNGDRARAAVATDATDLFLMLIRTGGFISAFYSVEAEQWHVIKNIKTSILFEQVGLSVTNDSMLEFGYDVVGKFDFFEIRPFFHPEKKRIPLVSY
jgi:beta-xylosidase